MARRTKAIVWVVLVLAVLVGGWWVLSRDLAPPDDSARAREQSDARPEAVGGLLECHRLKPSGPVPFIAPLAEMLDDVGVLPAVLAAALAPTPVRVYPSVQGPAKFCRRGPVRVFLRWFRGCPVTRWRSRRRSASTPCVV